MVDLNQLFGGEGGMSGPCKGLQFSASRRFCVLARNRAVCRMILALARALLSNVSSTSGERRVGKGVGPPGGHVRGRREAAQSLIAFALRLDVIVVWAVCMVLLIPLVLLSRVL